MSYIHACLHLHAFAYGESLLGIDSRKARTYRWGMTILVELHGDWPHYCCSPLFISSFGCLAGFESTHIANICWWSLPSGLRDCTTCIWGWCSRRQVDREASELRIWVQFCVLFSLSVVYRWSGDFYPSSSGCLMDFVDGCKLGYNFS